MTVEARLSVHLEWIVMPWGVPLTAREVLALCQQATEAQRRAALEYGRKHVPLVLPEEEQAAEAWVQSGKHVDLV